MTKKKFTADDLILEMHKDIKQIKEDLIPSIRIELKGIKVKTGIFATLTGLIGGALAFAGERFMKQENFMKWWEESWYAKNNTPYQIKKVHKMHLTLRARLTKQGK